MPDVRWTMSDRGFRHYAEVDGHKLWESSAAQSPHLWIDEEHVPVEDAITMRDALPEGHWRDTLTAAIDGHYQTRTAPLGGWHGGDPCSLCGSTSTHLENDKAWCDGCGVDERTPASTAPENGGAS